MRCTDHLDAHCEPLHSTNGTQRPRSPGIPDEKGSETSKDGPGHEVFAAEDPFARERVEDPTFKARIYFQPDPDYDIEAR